MKNLYDIRAVREMEKAAFLREDSFAVMRRAGAAVAGHAMQMLQGDSRPVLILAGPGNNGGDAFVAAAKLQTSEIKVRVVFVGEEKNLPNDSQQALANFRQTGGEIFRTIPNEEYALAIDGLFGIGLSRPIDGAAAEMIRKIRGMKILSIDAPSGINGDTGGALGETVFATRTITFFAAKAGLYTGAGVAAAGKVFVEDLGLQISELKNLRPFGMLHDSAADLDLQKLRRKKDGHKGAFGAAIIAGGAEGMTGALALASRASVRLGAGKTFALCAAAPPPFDSASPETMWRRMSDLSEFSNAECIAIGPGLGVQNVQAMQTVADFAAPVVADADALNILAADEKLAARFARRKESFIITPHPGEAARLLQTSAAKINNDRIAAAKTLAKKFNAVAVLKGAGCVVADADGEWSVCAVGNPGLSQAGAGDVLTGMLAALVAQSGDAKFSARAAVFLHAAAADQLANQTGEIGLNLNQIPPIAAKILNREAGRDLSE